MWSPIDIFSNLLPVCTGCGVSFDQRQYSPHILPCSHTLCLSCLTKSNSKKKRCPFCKTKFKSSCLNHALAETIKRVIARRSFLEQQSHRCDECDNRRPRSGLRRCLTCEEQIRQHIANGFTVDCTVCLVCCVDRHNGHQLVSCQSLSPSAMSIIQSQPRACSTPRLGVSSSSSEYMLPPSDKTTEANVLDPASSAKNGRLFRHGRIVLPMAPDGFSKGQNIVCEDSPVYHSMSTQRVRSRNGWMGRLTSLARRWSSGSGDERDCYIRTRTDHGSSGLGSDDSRLHDPTRSMDIPTGDHTCSLTEGNHNVDRNRVPSRLHYVNIASRSLDRATRQDTNHTNQSYDYITA